MPESSAAHYERFVTCLCSLLHLRTRELARKLTRNLAAVGDPRQRALSLGHFLHDFPPGLIVAVLGTVLEQAERRDSGADPALQALLHPEMRASWREGLSLQVQAVARLEGRRDLAGILLDLPPQDQRFEEPASGLPRELSKVPLGTRKSWARKTDIDLLEKLLYDPDRAVVANILDNPRLTLREVIRMASRNPVREKILEAVARHPKWSARYEVKLTLVYNPSTPTQLALRLLHFLMSQDLEKVSRDSRVSRVLVEKAKNLLKERTGARG
jgi:hypothetical protein